MMFVYVRVPTLSFVFIHALFVAVVVADTDVIGRVVVIIDVVIRVRCVAYTVVGIAGMLSTLLMGVLWLLIPYRGGVLVSPLMVLSVARVVMVLIVVVLLSLFVFVLVVVLLQCCW